MRFKLLAAGTHGDKSEAPVARNFLTAKVSFAYVFSAPLRLCGESFAFISANFSPAPAYSLPRDRRWA